MPIPKDEVLTAEEKEMFPELKKTIDWYYDSYLIKNEGETYNLHEITEEPIITETIPHGLSLLYELTSTNENRKKGLVDALDYYLNQVQALILSGLKQEGCWYTGHKYKYETSCKLPGGHTKVNLELHLTRDIIGLEKKNKPSLFTTKNSFKQ